MTYQTQEQTQEKTQEQIVSEIVKEIRTILSILVVLLINTTLIWYIANNVMEYPITWQFAWGGVLILRVIKLA